MEANVVWKPEKKCVCNKFSKKEGQSKLNDTLDEQNLTVVA